MMARDAASYLAALVAKSRAYLSWLICNPLIFRACAVLALDARSIA
jgi:hypothetical protein